MGLGFDNGAGFTQVQDLKRLGITVNRLSQEICCINKNLCTNVLNCLSGGYALSSPPFSLLFNQPLDDGRYSGLIYQDNTGVLISDGINTGVPSNIVWSSNFALPSGATGGYSFGTSGLGSIQINYTDPNVPNTGIQLKFDSTGFEFDGNNNTSAPQTRWNAFDGTNFVPIFAINGDGTVKADFYPNTRDDSGSVVPVNFLYTDGTGKLLSTNIQTLLAVLPSYVNNAAALAGGLPVGWSYYNTTTSSYTRVV